MPKTREEHITYTRDELNNLPYYKNMIDILNQHNIKSYLDIGANIGEFCNVLFDKVKTLQKAYLIEPEQENLNFMNNNLKFKEKTTIFEVAVGYNIKSPKIVSFHDNVGGFKILENSNEGIEVKLQTLEELSLPVVDFAKIDIEGGEYNLIENSTYLQSLNLIDIEWHHFDVIPMKEYILKYFPNHNILDINYEQGRSLIGK